MLIIIWKANNFCNTTTTTTSFYSAISCFISILFLELNQRHWKKQQPQESSFYSFMEQTRQGNGNNGREEIGNGEEELLLSVQPQAPGGTALGKTELPDGIGAFTRSYSEAPTMTPRSQRKLFTCRSEFLAIPLKSGRKPCNK